MLCVCWCDLLGATLESSFYWVGHPVWVKLFIIAIIIVIQVHLCEAERITDLLGDDFLIGRTGSTSMVVAVKTLRRDADDLAR